MEKVYIVTRTCYGEDYPEPETDIEIYSTEKKALKRFNKIIKEEADYLNNEDLELDVEEQGNRKRLDYTDYDTDYRVVLTMEEREVK